MKKVSVIIPCYNVERYITQCLETVISQTYSNLEIICIDDGSTDSTKQIIQEFMAIDSRIYLIEQENQYAGVARNNGLKKASGEYVFFYDGDDFLCNNILEKLVAKAKKTDADIVLCDAYFFDDVYGIVSEPKYVLNRTILEKVGEIFNCYDIPQNIFEICWSVPWNKLYKKKFLIDSNLKFQNIKRHNDEYFNTIALVMAKKIAHVQERLIYYRRNLKNSLQSYNPSELVDFSIFYSLLAIKEKLEEIDNKKCFEIAFKDKCLVSLVNILKKQKSYTCYESLYNKIKEEWIKALNLDDLYESRYKVHQRQLEKIKMTTAQDYLFEQYIKINEEKSRFVFPFLEVGNSKKIVLYAAGKKGKEFYGQLINQDFYIVSAWVDSSYEKYISVGLPVKPVDTINSIDYDKIVVAIDDPVITREVKNRLIEMNVPENIIITTERRSV